MQSRVSHAEMPSSFRSLDRISAEEEAGITEAVALHSDYDDDRDNMLVFPALSCHGERILLRSRRIEISQK